MKKLLLIILLACLKQLQAQCTISITGKDTICAGETTTLTALGATSYTWSTGVNTSTLSISVAGIYTVTGTTGTCTATNTVSITVSPVPTLTASSVTVCPGNLVSITVTVYPANSHISWTNSNTMIGLTAYGSGAPMPFIAPTNTTQATMHAFITYTPSINGCLGSIYSDTIEIKPTPFMQHISSQYLCPNEYSSPIFFNCIPSPTASDSVYYHWVDNGIFGPVITGTLNPFPALGPLLNTDSTTLCNPISVYSILNGCQGPDSTFSICVFSDPIVNFVLKQDSLSNNTYTALINYSSNVVFATWYWGDGSSSNGLFPSHVYATADSYSVCVSVQSDHGCVASTCQIPIGSMISLDAEDSPTDILKLSIINEQIKIYPNPSNGKFTIEPNKIEKQTIQIYDITGKTVFSQNINGKTDIDASSLSEGIYNISIISNDGIINRRLVIVR